MNDRDIVIGVVALLLIVGGVLFAVSGGAGSQTGTSTENSGPVDLTTREAKLAQCLKDSGATFYGAFWCPHCQTQKKLFGNASKLLPYVECSTPDGNNQTMACITAKVSSYPTWEFSDGSRETGEVSLDVLAQRSGCEPANGATATTSPLGETTLVGSELPDAASAPFR